VRRVEILILSWAPDARWLEYALKSIQRFAKGFSVVTVVYPNRDDDLLRPVCVRGDAKPYPHQEPPPPLGHLAQNLAKCKADLYCPDASHILHVDSDCIFTADATPDSFFLYDRPVLVRRHWHDAGDALYWREPTRRALGWEPPYETMAAPAIIYDARLYPLVRRHVSELHGRPFDDYVMGCRPTFPYGFCEHNALGGYAIERARELCTIVDAPWASNVRQLWSHDDLTPEMEEWLRETIDGGGEKRPPPGPGTMTEERRKLLGLDGR
jgi:hypothetical protein